MAVEDMYKTGGLEYVKTFCNEIDGFIYKVLLFIFHWLLNWLIEIEKSKDFGKEIKNAKFTASNIIQRL